MNWINLFEGIGFLVAAGLTLKPAYSSFMNAWNNFEDAQVAKIRYLKPEPASKLNRKGIYWSILFAFLVVYFATTIILASRRLSGPS